MSLRLYNSLTRKEEPFVPADPARVGMYVCGPTVYDRAHVGNARPVVVFDVLFRLLRRRYGEGAVTYVRNITDVDDKIIAAVEGGSLEAIAALTRRTTDDFHADMAALDCLPPTVEPRATAHIAEMIAMTARLIETGHAYLAERHVLFAVETSPGYGSLSGRNRDEQIAGARVDVAPYKKDPADFVLWKPSKEGEPGWDSPWGHGRPGWHIECSAMAARHLGPVFDIHGGGIDLIFPHHENEVAQSRCATGEIPARYWLHNGHVVVEGRKMSKSLGNFTTVDTLLKEWPGEVIRMALLSAHYRQPLDITPQLLGACRARLNYLYGVLRRAQPGGAETNGLEGSAIDVALKADLNTPQALTALGELAREVEAGNTPPATLAEAGDLLGLLGTQPDSWFRWQSPAAAGMSESEIEALIEARRIARAARDFQESDRLRNQLLASDIALEDTAEGTLWRRLAGRD